MALGVTSFTPRTGNVAPARHATDFNAPFTVAATFSGSCAQGEYRQYVKGTFKVNGSTLDHILCGPVKLQPTVFLEDGCPSGSCTAYGHRSCPQHPYDQYLPNRGDGCQFQMYDAPGFTNVQQGKTYNLDLTFEGKLINVGSGGTVLASATWTTTGSTTVSEPIASRAAVAFGDDDKFIGAHLTHNSESGAPELHLVVVRPPGRPPLDAAAITVEMLDASGRRGKPQQAPAVYEVGNPSRSTASIVFSLSPGEITPARVELAIHGGQVAMRVERR